MIRTRFDTLLSALAAAPSRRVALRILGGLGLAGLGRQTAAKKKHKRKKCAKAGQQPGKKRKRCCAGLVLGGSGTCGSASSSPPPCVPTACPPNACGSVPDGCGGTLQCGGCPANHLCLRSGVCQPCTVTCTGTPEVCGTGLQEALGALETGQTLYVCPGTYRGGFTLAAGARVIGAGDGADDASNTILDAGGVGGDRVLVSLGVPTVELERLRFTGANTADPGGGIDHEGGGMLRMTECTISGNTADDGGGIHVPASQTLELTRCTIRDNHAMGGFSVGGGIFVNASKTTLTDCLIEDNDAKDDGGGIFHSGGMTILAGSTLVRGNTVTTANGRGGGIFVANGTLTIAETCRVTENTAPATLGGGIFTADRTVTLQGVTPSPIVVNNCHENCAVEFAPAVPGCSTDPPTITCP